MGNDIEMARGANEEGVFNLAIGEPVFIQEAYHLNLSKSTHVDFGYPPPTGIPSLKDLLEDLNPGHIAVVTNGAKQALQASMAALRSMDNEYAVSVRTPFWPSLETLASNAGVQFKNPITNGANICVFPGNPDGISAELPDRTGIWDAVYQSPIYYPKGGFIPEPFKSDEYKVKIGSLSKEYGLSGLRVGWALVNKDYPDLARAIAHQVEITTSGVSTVAQSFAERVIRFHEVYDKEKARETLNKNGRSFNTHIARYCSKVMGVPANQGGMFAWLKAKLPRHIFKDACRAAKVLVVDGRSCGAPDGWFRISMGHNAQYTERALFTLRRELFRQLDMRDGR
jgi:aspartate/methionine/tyrosine aminotransferase